MDCRNIRILIDQADKGDSLPLEASRHADGCPQCRGFADERLRLRRLLAASSRVTAPANFDAMLRARLARGRSRNWLGWFVPALSMRGAAAVAMLAIAAFAVQLFLINSKKIPVETAVNQTRSTNAANAAMSSGDNKALPGVEINTAPGAAANTKLTPIKSTGRRGINAAHQIQARNDIEPIEAAAVLLMRDLTLDRQFTVSAISIGAQPIMSLDGDSQRSRIVRTSF